MTYAIAAVLLLSIGVRLWVTLLFPLWVLVLSVYLLLHGIDATPEAVP